MSDFELSSGLYLAPTPSGAFYAASASGEDIYRRLLLRLMARESSPELTTATLCELTEMDEQGALEHLYRMQSLHLVQGLRDPRYPPEGALETVLPNILADLCSRNKALLADEQGFYLGSFGYHHETAEELAGLSADLGILHQRHQGLLAGNLSLRSAAWGVIDASGNSQIGFWPLYIGEQRFALVLAGMPNFNRDVTLDLIWVLVNRYGR